MALIKCPECEKEISDKALKCPNCGYPLKDEPTEEKIDSSTISETIISKDNGAREESTKKAKRKKIILDILILLLLSIIMVAVLFNMGVFKRNLSVKEISLSKWKLLDEGEYFDVYEGSVASDEIKPFVAVIGYYEGSDSTPKFVYMENGKGTLQTSESSDDDPSIKYTAIGYMNGKEVKESDVSSIKSNDSNYYDGNYGTSCTVNVDIELKNKQDGLLVLELKNDLTKDIDKNITVVIIDGKGEYSYYLSDLPLKSRGVEVTVIPRFFCSSKVLKETDYIIEKPFSLEKDEGKYTTSFLGKEELLFNEYEDGLVIYTEELLDGGKKELRGEVVQKSAYLKDNQCVLSTYIWESIDEKILTPSYDIRVIGYLNWIQYKNN